MDIKEKSIMLHEKYNGKISVVSKVPVTNREELSLAYTPGVAEPCLQIEKDPEKSFKLTSRANLVAVITDGSAVLGLGNIGPRAGMPVMEGKCVLFKEFADIDAFPLCINSNDIDEIVNTIKLISYSFGGINLEDIAAPRCFIIEEKLKKLVDIPVYHDDQHGTSVVVLAALLNALKLKNIPISDARIVLNGAGAAGIAISKLLVLAGAKDLTICDKSGPLYVGLEGMTPAQAEMAIITNKRNTKGTLKDALKDADVFIGVSAPNIVTEEMVASMAKDPIVFPMANPTPEIMPDKAKNAGAFIIGTGRSDFPNQINNVLAFPGVFKGTLMVRAKDITEKMNLAAAYAIADTINESELTPEYIIPDVFDKRVVENVSKAVAKAAIEEGLAQI